MTGPDARVSAVEPVSAEVTRNGQAHTGYRPDIDGLRAIAVLLVVGFHAFPERIPGGYVGVDVFFVISGFLISSIILKGLADGSFRFSVFYGRRIRRIFTALVIVLAACYVIGSALLLPDEHQQLGKHIAGGAGFVSNFVLWGESDYFDSAAELKPLLHLWSLGIEEQFYLVWPVVLVLAWRFGRRPLAVSLVVLGASFALNVWTVSAGQAVAAFYSPLTRVWELMLGSVLAMLSLRRRVPVHGGNRRSLAGACLLFVAVILLDRDSPFPGWLATLPTLGTVLLISGGPHAHLNRLVLSARPLVWIGLISFPLYLWHWPLLSFARISGESTELSRELRIAIVMASGLLAWLTYVLVERRVRFGSHAQMKVAALCVLMLSVGGIGYHAYASDDFRSRFPPIAQEIGSFKFEYKKAYRGGSCFLWSSQDATIFRDECRGNGRVLLWGDSHAAHLYPGLSQSIPGLAQFTKAGCPPILGALPSASLHCQNVNAYVMDVIRQRRPDVVILAGAWANFDFRSIRATVQALQDASVLRIDLVGPFPQWKNSLPRTLMTHLRRHDAEDLPQRLKAGWDRTALTLDRDMRAFAAAAGVRYVSPMDILCDDDGCLTRVDDDAASLVAWDQSHLTGVGSAYVASRFADLPGAAHHLTQQAD